MLAARVEELERELLCSPVRDSQGDFSSWAAQRLSRSVLRPLRDALRRLGAGREDPDANPDANPDASAGLSATREGVAPSIAGLDPVASPLDQRLWQLAEAATTLRIVPGLPTEIQEATAAMQDVAWRFATAADVAGDPARTGAVREIQAHLPPGIQLQVNGPYLVTNAANLVNRLGEPMPTRPQMALCRCGASKIKPFCDGSHADISFTDGKDPKRVPDQRDIHDGVGLTVLDNRGTCAHSGFCTDRLPSAFHVGKEPFVTPSGARQDDVIRAVRSCPSGALSYAVNGREARDQVDQVREPGIEISKDGPYRITGGLPLLESDGRPVPRGQGASLEHYSLCRCGHSQNKPFCSGMHWYVNFRDPEPPADHQPTLFEWAGGLPALRLLTRIFYSKHVPEDPLIGPLFANMSPDHPERVASWLGEVFGGPKNYSEKYGGYTRMISQHLGKGLSEAQRARWVSLLCHSADEAGLPADPEFRAAFVSYIEWGSRLALENSQPGAKPPPRMPMPRWWWVCDATPGSRVSALAPAVEAAPVVLPSATEALSFARHIKPLFRAQDRQSMTFIFDLWAHDDVTKHAQAILGRLQDGTMPCDGAWPKERVEVFRRWVESGAPE